MSAAGVEALWRAWTSPEGTLQSAVAWAAVTRDVTAAESAALEAQWRAHKEALCALATARDSAYQEVVRYGNGDPAEGWAAWLAVAIEQLGEDLAREALKAEQARRAILSLAFSLK